MSSSCAIRNKECECHFNQNLLCFFIKNSCVAPKVVINQKNIEPNLEIPLHVGQTLNFMS
jgi:hypothetical protein